MHGEAPGLHGHQQPTPADLGLLECWGHGGWDGPLPVIGLALKGSKLQSFTP